MKAPEVATVDFETAAIRRRPDYPPKPVGFSIKLPGDRKSRYFAWGHPTANNCEQKQAAAVLKDLVKGKLPILFHNAKFDVDVMETHLGIKAPSWERIHDTMYLLFLEEPHAMTFALKPSAERLLGLAPTERDAVRDWLMEHQGDLRASGLLPLDEKITLKNFGAYISLAPGNLVGVYADGDVTRTLKLFQNLFPRVHTDGMMGAYNRERELMPILLENERQGIRLDVPLLLKHIKLFNEEKIKADAWLRKRLKAKELNVDSNAELVEALERSGIVTDFVLTAKGQRSASKANLTGDRFRDLRVFRALGYRNRLATCIGTFMEPWLEMGLKDGHVYTNWNQVRQSGSGDNSRGARTGRLSSNPNFQNIPKVFNDKDDGYAHPDHLDVAELPLLRQYLLPDKGEVFLHRDYNQQELRILAHYEDDKLLEAYKDNPKLDVHTYVGEQIEAVTGLKLERRAVKILDFGMVYGMGLAKLAIGIHSSVDEARVVKDAQRRALPGLPALERDMKEMGRNGIPIRTWGGRLYYCEPPKLIDGRKCTFEYKLLNYLIQGSAADCTKQAVINHHKTKKDSRLLVTVHDEINLTAPKDAVKSEMAILKKAMESVPFEVPMITDGKTGKNWMDLKEFKE